MFDISIIIPCYNSENLIKRTATSLIKQKIFNNMFILFIDDCSSDNTYNILKEYTTTYNNIKAIKTSSHIGVFNSIRLGVKYIKSEWVGFINIGDQLTETYFEELYNETKKIENIYVDIIETSRIVKMVEVNKFVDMSKIYNKMTPGDTYEINSEYVNNVLCYQWNTLYNKIFRLDIIRKILEIPPLYNLNKLYDVLITWVIILFANKIHTAKINAYYIVNDFNKSEYEINEGIINVFHLINSFIHLTNKTEYLEGYKKLIQIHKHNINEPYNWVLK